MGSRSDSDSDARAPKGRVLNDDTPQLVALLVAPTRALAEDVARVDASAPRWSEILAALSAPTAIVGAAIAFVYADTLLAPHFIGNVLLLAASFGIQSFAVCVVARVLYRRSARRRSRRSR